MSRPNHGKFIGDTLFGPISESALKGLELYTIDCYGLAVNGIARHDSLIVNHTALHRAKPGLELRYNLNWSGIKKGLEFEIRGDADLLYSQPPKVS